MRRGACLVPPKEPKAKPRERKPKAETPKVDVEKLKEQYLPPAEPEKERFEDERIHYYRLMAKAIWVKCSDCANGQASMTSAGYFVPKCIRTSCSLYSYRDEFFKEEIRRGSPAENSDGSVCAGDGGKGKGTPRRRKAVSRTADNEDNVACGTRVRRRTGDKKDPGVADAPGTGTPGKGEGRVAGRGRVRRSGGDTH